MTNTSNHLPDSVLVSCTEPGCIAFPFSSLTELAEHAVEGHIYEVPSRSRFADEGLTERGDNVDRPERGDGAGTSTGRPAPQAFTFTKVGDVWAVRVPAGRHSTGEVVEVSKKNGGTSTVTLGRHLRADDRFDVFASGERTADAPTTYRWTKSAGEWLVTGPAAEVGAAITITKADGSTVEAVIDSVVVAGTYRVRQGAAATPERAPRGEVPEGLHSVDGAVFKVQTSKSGNRYANRLVGTSWDYEPGAIRLLSADTLMSLDEAKAYGKDTGVCCCCGKTLTNPESIEAGIGPVCASKF